MSQYLSDDHLRDAIAIVRCVGRGDLEGVNAILRNHDVHGTVLGLTVLVLAAVEHPAPSLDAFLDHFLDDVQTHPREER